MCNKQTNKMEVTKKLWVKLKPPSGDKFEVIFNINKYYILSELLFDAGFLDHEVIDWKFMLIFTAIAVVGIFTGSYMSSKISNDKLKPVFGWFVLVMGIYILLKETVLK